MITAKSTTLSIIITTYPDQETADVLVKQLLSKQLAACIQQSLITSNYVWEGKQETASEIKLEIKTLSTLFDEVSQCIREHHPYECPEIISVTINQSNDEYADWVQKNVKAG